jgi:hypothetical protein
MRSGHFKPVFGVPNMATATGARKYGLNMEHVN